MQTIEESPCPVCATVCSLALLPGYRTGSILVQSASGARLQLAAFEVPRMVCSECGLDTLGEYHPDGNYISFSNITAARRVR